MSKMNYKLLKSIIVNILGVFIVLLFTVPLMYVFISAVKTNSEFLRNPLGLPQEWRFDIFVQAWQKAKLGVYSLNSVFYTVVCVTISILMAVFLAFPIARNYFKLCKFIYLAFVAGMFLPGGMIPLWRMVHAAGLYNTRLGYMLLMLGGGGVTLFFFVAYIKNLPKDFDEAASIDGCGYIHYVSYILIPLMRPAIASMVVLSAIGVWNEVLNSILYLSNDALYPITRGIYAFKGAYSVQWNLICASLVIVATPIVILYYILQKHIIAGIMAGGVKG